MLFRTLAQAVIQRPQMYVHPVTFGAVCAYLSGFDAACEGGPLCGFREWLLVRVKGWGNLSWQGLIERIGTQGAQLAEDQAIRGLGELLEEFFQHRDQVGLPQVFHEYTQWLDRERANWDNPNYDR
jgi:hypothetical protein